MSGFFVTLSVILLGTCGLVASSKQSVVVVSVTREHKGTRVTCGGLLVSAALAVTCRDHKLLIAGDQASCGRLLLMYQS